MNNQRFDALSRALVLQSLPRRLLLSGLGGGLLAIAGGFAPDRLANAAKKTKRKKRKKKPLQRNEYGCVPVGKACRGNDNVCCSGICDGKKPKKGERDRTQCEAHDTGGCVKGQQTDYCRAGGMDNHCMSSAGNTGICETTTGNAGFCAYTGACAECRTDSDCHATTGNPSAACIRCVGCPVGTACLAP